MRGHGIAAACGVAAALVLAGCAGAPSDTVEPRPEFPAGAPFDYQLGGGYAPPDGVEVVVRDRTDVPEPGAYSICYVNAFQTQPGEQDDWPAELLLHDSDGAPVTDPDWPDEVLLDLSTPERRDAIADVLGDWTADCAADGFAAVEFDNLDSFTRSGDAFTVDDATALAAVLVADAHAHGLAVGQKNAAEFAERLRDDAGFDFAVSEECAAYAECEAYTDAYGDAVLNIEYVDNLPRPFVEACADAPARTILRDRDLVTPGDDGYRYDACG